jgi:hypothetical protein
MGCRRCEGLMVKDCLTDLACEGERVMGPIYRCVSCGEVVDRVILTNRLPSRPRSHPHTRQFTVVIGR